MPTSSIYGLFDPRFPDVMFYVGKGTLKRVESHWKFFSRNGRAVNRLLARKFEALASDGVQPSYRWLEENVVDWQSAERKWIAYWREINPDLCNVADGGNSWPLDSSRLGGMIGGRVNAAKPGYFASISNLASTEARSAGAKRANETVRRKYGEEIRKEWGMRGAVALRGNLSPEARLKMSLAKKGKPSPRKGAVILAESRLKMSLARRGRTFGPLSEEHRRKVSLSNTGKVHNISAEGLEVLRSLGSRHKGRKRSDETRLRMSHHRHRVQLKDSCKLCREEFSTIAYG